MGLEIIDQRLLNEFQRDFPLVSRPYAHIAEQLGISEQEVLLSLDRHTSDRTISRIGAIIPPNVVGASMLVALKIPEDDVARVAQWISGFPEVNHNYSREHDFNLWFVMTADDDDLLGRRLDEIELQSGYPMLRLPLLEAYHIDLGFPIDFSPVAESQG